MRKRKQRREAEFKRQLKKRAEREKLRPAASKGSIIWVGEYYQPAFYHFGAALAQQGDSRGPTHHRSDFWRTIPSGTYDGAQARELLERYFEHLDRTLKTVIERHSVAYWLHVFRRFAPLPIGRDRDPQTIQWTRASLDAAIQKYGRAELCDGIDYSDRVDGSTILHGFLKQHNPRAIDELRQHPQLVLTNFALAEYREALDTEKLAYEVWRTMAQLRTVGKGAPLKVTHHDEFVHDDRSDDLDFLVTNFDVRALPFATTATGTVFENDFNDGPRGLILLPKWNADGISFERLRPLYRTFIQRELYAPGGGPNFVWTPLNLAAYYEAHRYFGDAFRQRHGVSLESVLGIIGTLAAGVLAASVREPMQFFFRMWQRGYEAPARPADLKQSLADIMPDALPSLGIPLDLAAGDLDAAFDFLTLTDPKRQEIDLGYAGPHCPFLPCGDDRIFVDYAYLFQRLYYLFHRIEVSDQNFKGTALEALTHRGKSALPTGELRGNDGSSKQVDAAFGIEDLLVICECRAVARSIAVERGHANALAKRQEVIDKALGDIDEKAQWLVAHPKGANYDVTTYRYVLPIGVTPFIEFISSRDAHYWIDENLPRVLSPHELKTAMDSHAFLAAGKKCANTVQLR